MNKEQFITNIKYLFTGINDENINFTIELIECNKNFRCWPEIRVNKVTSYNIINHAIILNCEQDDNSISPYKFKDLSVFDDVVDVVFNLNGHIISDFNYADTSYSEQCVSYYIEV